MCPAFRFMFKKSFSLPGTAPTVDSKTEYAGEKFFRLAERSRFLKRLALVDLVRSFSILCVLAIHADAFLARPQNPSLAWAWNHFQRNGTYGVYLFFLVS